MTPKNFIQLDTSQGYNAFMWGGAGTQPCPENSSLTYIAIAAVVVGGLVSSYGTYKQGQAAKATAAAQADQAAREAQQQLMVSRIQEAVAARQALFDQKLAQAEAEAANQNSIALKNEAEAEVAQSREQMKRVREDQLRKREEARLGFAASGFLDTTGSSLANLAEQAANDALTVANMHYSADVQRTHKLFASDIEKQKGIQKGAAAALNYELATDANKVRAIGARVTYFNQIRGADITRWAGKQAAANATISAVGQGIGALGGLAKV